MIVKIKIIARKSNVSTYLFNLKYTLEQDEI